MEYLENVMTARSWVLSPPKRNPDDLSFDELVDDDDLDEDDLDDEDDEDEEETDLLDEDELDDEEDDLEDDEDLDDEDLDEEEEDEEDEDEEDEEDEKAKKAVRVRNALRAAGHRRGIAAERSRLATIFNGLDPDKAAMAVTLALEPKTADVPADQIRALVDAAPAPQAAAGDRSAFGKVMDRISAVVPGPGFGGGDTQGKGPSLSGQMAKMLKLPK